MVFQVQYITIMTFRLILKLVLKHCLHINCTLSAIVAMVMCLHSFMYSIHLASFSEDLFSSICSLLTTASLKLSW